MNGPDHRMAAAATWVAVSIATWGPTWQTLAGIPIAVLFSAGRTSPDIDNTRGWKTLDRWIPDEWLGAGGPLGHRRLMHWWGIPAAAAALTWLLMPAPLAWAAYAGIIGWASHLAFDAIFGKAGYGTPRGIPVGPWFWHIGAGLKSDGRAQHLTLIPILTIMVWVACGHPTPHLPHHPPPVRSSGMSIETSTPDIHNHPLTSTPTTPDDDTWLKRAITRIREETTTPDAAVAAFNSSI